MREQLLLRISLLGFVALSGCDNGPHCSDVIDGTGRPIVMCGARQAAVCDLEGDEARFEDGAGGITLVGGERARCDASGEVVCPSGATEAYCLFDPAL